MEISKTLDELRRIADEAGCEIEAIYAQTEPRELARLRRAGANLPSKALELALESLDSAAKWLADGNERMAWADCQVASGFLQFRHTLFDFVSAELRQLSERAKEICAPRVLGPCDNWCEPTWR